VNARALQDALGALGLECTVETRERLAVLIPPTMATPVLTGAMRQRVVALARAHGFSHVALEIPVGVVDASLSLD
jgi:hypothetical protein